MALKKVAFGQNSEKDLGAAAIGEGWANASIYSQNSQCSDWGMAGQLVSGGTVGA